MRTPFSILSGTDENGDGVYYSENYGNSLETKPTEGVGDGAVFVEVDTGKVFMFNENTGDWVEEFSLQG